MSIVDRVDAYQRDHTWVGYPLAVIYKLFDDRGPYLAALMTYYAFVSLFPLLLLFFSVLGYVAASNHNLYNNLQSSAFADLPFLRSDLQKNVSTVQGGYHGSSAGIIVGVVGTLYGGTGVMQAAQAAFNRIYAVPRNEQPNPIKSRVRSFGLLLVLGLGVLLTTGLTALVSTSNSIDANLTVWVNVAARILSVLINILLFSLAFQLLVARWLAFRRVIVGGVIAGVVWFVLQTEGSAYAQHELHHSSQLYGTFGLVLGTIAWIYLEALVVVICAEINVVLHKRLWPRALLTPFTDAVELTGGDLDAYVSYARSERYKGFEQVNAHFDKSAQDREMEGPPPDVRPEEQSGAHRDPNR